jgi:uncharacterized protein involved in exopolysaccharide biosynthesis
MDQRTTRGADLVDLGIRELLADVWQAKWIVIAIALVFGITGFVSGILLPKHFRAEVLISPVADSPTGGGALSALASQYSGLASLAGISLSGHGGNNKEETIAVLQSELITEAYVRVNNLLPTLFAKSWDEHANRWKTNDPKKIPTLWMANQSFRKIREVKEDRVSGLVTLRITWGDPVIAAKWANDLVKTTNQYLREKAIKESERNIDYLNQEAAKTNIIEARTAIYSILKDEVNKQMIAKGREEYALKILDPARVPEGPSSPSALLLAYLGIAAGIVVSALFVFARRSVRRTNPNA